MLSSMSTRYDKTSEVNTPEIPSLCVLFMNSLDYGPVVLLEDENCQQENIKTTFVKHFCFAALPAILVPRWQ